MLTSENLLVATIIIFLVCSVGLAICIEAKLKVVGIGLGITMIGAIFTGAGALGQMQDTRISAKAERMEARGCQYYHKSDVIVTLKGKSPQFHLENEDGQILLCNLGEGFEK